MTDQFGTRTVTKLEKISMLCAPAPKGAAEVGWLGKIELATCIAGHAAPQYSCLRGAHGKGSQ